MGRADRWAVGLLGLLLVAALAFGWRAARRPAPPPMRRAGGLDLQGGVALRQGIDPLHPPGLPPGARIDPVSGLLIDVALGSHPGEQALSWPELRPANAIQSASDLPAALRALDGRRVVMAGFLMPLYALHEMREFALVGSHYTCCFARPPGLGDQVIVRLAPSAQAQALTVKPLRIQDRLRVLPQSLYDSGKGPLISLFELVDAHASPLE